MAPALIVALDVDSGDAAREIVDALGADAGFYKIGLQLLTADGRALAHELVAQGKQVFLDLKLYAIPNSVAGAVMAAGRLGASLVTVHASAGSSILRAAVAAGRPFPGLQVLALTVVTSLRDEDLHEVGLACGVQEQVLRLARLAEQAGCHGVVASPQEAALLKSTLGPAMLIVTPGIQLAGEAATDQARATTPAAAVRAGATHLVVGRSVAQAGDPRAAFAALRHQVEQAFK